MKSTTLMLTLIATSLLGTAAASEGPKVLQLSSQPVPLTTAVSNEFYQFSAKVPAPDMAQALAAGPKTQEGWQALIAQRDAKSIETAKAMSKQLNTHIEPAQIAGVSVYWVTPANLDPALKDKLFVVNQGGGYVFNSGYAATIEASVIAHHLQMPVLAIDYAKAPAHPAPAGRDDIVVVWKALLETRSAKDMVMGGSSAGATLSVLTQQELIAQGIPTAAALYIGTPSVDMTMTGDSRYINEGLDHVLVSWRGFGSELIDLYVGGLSKSDPRVSPINGSFAGFPPSYLITGTRDLLLSDTIRLDRALKRAGVSTELNVYEGQSHGDYMLAFGTPESTEHYQALASFMRAHLLQ